MTALVERIGYEARPVTDGESPDASELRLRAADHRDRARVAAGVALSGFVVAVVTTWTPGRLRLSSAVHDVEPSCDEALGTCEVMSA